MKTADYLALDATGLSEVIRNRQVSPTEVLEAAIARAEQVNPTLNAICLPLYQQARNQVETVKGPFQGVPFLLKDLGQEQSDAPCTFGSQGLRNNRPAQDSEFTRRCRLAGLNIMGRTATPELGLKAVTESRLWGPSLNPWDHRRTPGGSSGGSGAAVAAGIVPMAGANDGGGSIRIPAAYNGLFGLKPSRGRVSAAPYHSETWTGASADLVVSRSVRDSALLLDQLAGNVPGDPFTIANPVNRYRDMVRRPPESLRIGFFTHSPYGTAVSPDCVAAVEDTARLLEELGHQVVPAAPRYDGPALARSYLTLYFGEVAAAMADAMENHGAKSSDFEVETRFLGMLGQSLSALEYVRDRRLWNHYARALGNFFGDYDLYLCPTTGQPPALIGELETPSHLKFLSSVMVAFRAGKMAMKSGVVDDLALQSLARTPFTQLANLTGTPAMSMPLHWNQEGLPVGVHFGAAHGREDLLFQLAGQLEQARPWWHRYLPLQDAF
ncbi:MAG: amidase [Halomonadaceae bacterium]|nr:MAG: amidase [Halomonadaceae bacterium]